jgi:hypothetical protein
MVTVAFLAVVGTGVMAHNGRISNVIDDPSEADEHPWGGGNSYTDDPVLTASPIDDPALIDSKYYFLGITIKHSWLSIRDFLMENIGAFDVKSSGESTPLPADNDTNTTDQGTRN